MPWREAMAPVPMYRVAVVAPAEHLRDALCALADAGVVEVDEIRETTAGSAASALRQLLGRADAPPVHPVILPAAPDIRELAAAGRLDELGGEAEMERVMDQTVTADRVAALTGWCPRSMLGTASERLALVHGAVVPLAPRGGAMPPTLLDEAGPSGAFQPLVDAYGTVPYRNVNPSLPAGLAYAAMFGMMFGDVGHGLLLVAGGLFLRARSRRLVWMVPFIVGAGLASVGFGLAYGEAFGPTGLVPALWLRPLDRPTTLLAVAVAVGGALLAVAYGVGIVNRWREAGPRRALLAWSGVAGTAIYLGAAAGALGLYAHLVSLQVAGAAIAVAGLVSAFAGSYLQSGGRAVGAMQATVETFDGLARVGSNTVSFARLAAFGLTHAALSQIVWQGTSGLARHGLLLWIPAGLLFVVGNGLAFALEGLVAAVQALRLEYYELFSRIFVDEGRRFRPWRIPTAVMEEAACSSG